MLSGNYTNPFLDETTDTNSHIGYSYTRTVETASATVVLLLA